MRRISGFTLIELMVAIVVAVVLLTVAVPGFVNVMQSGRITAMTNDFVTAVLMARSEAVKRGKTVYVIATDPSTPENEWGNGWKVCVEVEEVVENENKCDDADDRLLLLKHEALAGEATLNSMNDRTTLAFDASGFFSPAGGNPADTFELRIPKCLRDDNRDLVLDNTGRLSISRVECSS